MFPTDEADGKHSFVFLYLEKPGSGFHSWRLALRSRDDAGFQFIIGFQAMGLGEGTCLGGHGIAMQPLW